MTQIRKGGKKGGDAASKKPSAEEAERGGEDELGEATLKPLSRTKIIRCAQLDHQNLDFEQTLKMRKTASLPNLMRRNKDVVQERSEENKRVNLTLGRRLPVDTSFLEGQQSVHIYSGQKLNTAELQKAAMRKQIEPHSATTMWTFSPIYNTQAFEF